MKKLILAGGLLCAILLSFGKAHAATPLDQAGQNAQGPYWNTTLLASSAPASSFNATIIFPALTKSSGGQTINARNCLTRLVLQMSVGTTFYLLDGGTTDYVIYGFGLGTSGTNTLNLAEDHLGPLCGTAGNTMTLSMPAPGANTPDNVINAEGYTFAGYTNNAAQ
jgi:hypothetical protein